MPSWITVVFILLIAATIASLFIGRTRRAGGPVSGASGYASGTLTITGVSGRGDADKSGQAYFTVSGTIIGPDTAPTEVYTTLALPAEAADPFIGEERPVVYKPGKTATTWRFGTLEA
ncbi:hypothetical protein MUG78_01895 [Gordonia alkaliphila]|uniref:DUF3592 domain-containing protein n=1 Tax=Gordonia alkaliphila TaxID=1053547 RepID=A0ABP8ZGU7_9ACTN|nr:hypothetical protein [Gordonia alkaliphila]MCK0438246.1 hypothetical protein [Gordonia alkaliphila]